MKKLIIIFILVISLSACKSKDPVEEISFNGSTYTYSETGSDGYDMFTSNGKLIEILYDDGEFIFSFEIDTDIFLVLGSEEFYKITKNGETIIIAVDTSAPTGSESVGWSEDILPIMDQYKKAND